MQSRWTYRLALIGLLAGAAGLYLWGNQRDPLWDRDEPRYAECSREMLKSGDWVVPRFLGDLRPHKPPLVYWCQVLAMEALGDTAEAARLPSSIAMLLTAALLAAFVRIQSDWPRALWSVAIFCTCVLTVAAAKVCITDAVLLLWMVIGQGCLFLAWKNRRASWPLAVIFWISVGVAGLTKGPVVLWIHAMTLLVLAALEAARSWAAWKRAVAWWRQLHPLVGLLIVAVIVCPWLIWVQRRAPDFIHLMLLRTGRYASSGAEGHAQWPGFYLLTIWVTMFPWCLLLPMAIVIGFRRRGNPFICFVLACAIGPWLAMELVPNKLPFYILPSYPALAVLTAEVIVSAADELKPRPFLVGVAVWGLAALGVAIAPMFFYRRLGGPESIEILWLVLGLVYLGTVAGAFVLRRVRFAAGAMAGGIAILMAVFFNLLLPNLPPLSASRVVGEDLISLGAGGATHVAMIDFREPSLAFYQGGGTRESDPTALASASPPIWAVITTDAWDRLSPAVQGRYRILSESQSVLRYNDGWRLSKLIIIRKK